MQQGIPGSPPPRTWAPGNNDLGPQAAIQSKRSWTAAEDQSKPEDILSAMRAPHLWRVSVVGQNVTVQITYGTSSAIVLRNLSLPIRITVPGSCEVSVTPIQHDVAQAADAEVTCTPATSGCCDSICRSFINIPLSGVVQADPLAVRFVALTASTLRVGPGDNHFNVTLAALESVDLVPGSAILTGGGFLEFEP